MKNPRGGGGGVGGAPSDRLTMKQNQKQGAPAPSGRNSFVFNPLKLVPVPSRPRKGNELQIPGKLNSEADTKVGFFVLFFGRVDCGTRYSRRKSGEGERKKKEERLTETDPDCF